MKGNNYLSVRMFFIMAFSAGVQRTGERASQKALPKIIYILADDPGWKNTTHRGHIDSI